MNIESIDPTEGPLQGGNSVTITGSDLQHVTRVQFDAKSVVPDSVSPTKVVARVPAASADQAQPVEVRVGQPGEPPSSNARAYRYVPAPVITGFAARDKELELRGLNFAKSPSRSVVLFGSMPATVLDPVDDTTIRARRGPGPAGPVSVSVVSPGGTSNAVTVTLPVSRARSGIFWIQLAWMVALLTLGLVYATESWDRFPRSDIPNPLATIPLGVIWFGALGAATLSLSGVVFHQRDFDSGYLFWYITRPVFGAVFGVVVYLIFAGAILTTGGQPGTAISTSTATTSSSSATPSASATSPPATATAASSSASSVTPAAASTPAITASASAAPTAAPTPAPAATPTPTPSTPQPERLYLYYVIAFIIGYREATFRSLLARVSDLIIGPGDGSNTPNGAGGSHAGGAQPGGGAATKPAA